MGGYGSGRHGSKGTTASYRQLTFVRCSGAGSCDRVPGPRGSGRGMVSESRPSKCGQILIASCSCTVIAAMATRSGPKRNIRFGWKGHAIIFGGERAWFLCPRPGCGRRVATLWGGAMFFCRHCQGLAYESQNETAHSRALSRVQAIRVKLGGEPGLIHDFPDKPKGMHWRTYDRLRAQADEAENRSWPPWVYTIMAKAN